MIDRIASLLKMQKPLLNRGFLIASGATVPSDTTDGYQTGCIFMHTDGGGGTALYVNEGSITSSLFTPVSTDDVVGDLAVGGDLSVDEGIISMGSQGDATPLSTAKPFAIEVQGAVAADVVPGATGLSAGIYSRYEVAGDQTTQCSHVSVVGKLRVKADLADGAHAGVLGYVEISGAGTVISGTSSTTTAAGQFSVESDASFELSTGHLNGVCVDSSVNSGATLTGSFVGVRVKKSGSSKAWEAGITLEDSACTVGIDVGTCTTAGIALTGTQVTGIDVGSAATGIDFTGTYTGNVIDFSNATIDPTGSGGPCFIRMGAYGSEIDYGADDDQSGAIRIYTTSSGSASYDRGIFVCTVTTGTKVVYPIAGLAEINNTGTGPASSGAGQFIAHLGARSSGANLATLGGGSNLLVGMYGLVAKVVAAGTAVCDSGSRAAAIWCDNQMSGTLNGEDFGIFATTGASRPNAFIGFSTNSSGYSQLLSCDTTFDSGAGTCFQTASVPGTQDARIKVWYDGLQYYIPLHR